MDRIHFIKAGLIGMGSAMIVKQANALEFYHTRSSDRKWAILFATWYGSSRDVGIWISEGLGGIADVYDMREKPDLSGYDHVVIGSSIQWGKIHPDLEDYIKQNQAMLTPKVMGMWAVCGNVGRLPGEKEYKNYIDNQMAMLLKAPGVPAKVFGGRTTPGILSDKDRIGLKKAGEKYKIDLLRLYDNLSRLQIIKFGEDILKASQHG